jgi:signal transduction histidine kinase
MTMTTADLLVTLTVTNPAPGAAGTGSGLVGLRERLRLLGGLLDVETHDGQFTLTARVPVT